MHLHVMCPSDSQHLFHGCRTCVWHVHAPTWSAIVWHCFIMCATCVRPDRYGKRTSMFQYDCAHLSASTQRRQTAWVYHLWPKSHCVFAGVGSETCLTSSGGGSCPRHFDRRTNAIKLRIVLVNLHTRRGIYCPGCFQNRTRKKLPSLTIWRFMV